MKKGFGEDVHLDYIPCESEYEESYALDTETEVDGFKIPVKLYTIFQDSKVYIITLVILPETSEEMRNLMAQVVGTFRVRE